MSKLQKWGTGLVGLLVASGPAWATVPTVDYTTSVTAVKTELVDTITPLVPVLFAILAILAAIGLVRSLVRRFAKG